MKFFSLLIIATASAVTLRGPDAATTAPAADAVPAVPAKKEVKPIAWDKDTLPACPKDASPGIPRTLMDDAVTFPTKFPRVGATCKMQIGNSFVVMYAKPL